MELRPEPTAPSDDVKRNVEQPIGIVSNLESSINQYLATNPTFANLNTLEGALILQLEKIRQMRNKGRKEYFDPSTLPKEDL